MNSPHRRTELKAFLRARRAALTPEDLGLPRGTRRLTPGLRREEVAAAAGVGVTWYTWLEQGRDIRPSPSTLRQLARALRLNAADEAYLFSLARVPQQRLQPQAVTIPPALMSALETYRGPAVVFNSMFGVLAFNRIARLLYLEATAVGPYFENQMWQLCMNPQRRSLYPDYEHDIQHFVGLFRLSAAGQLENPRFRTLVAALLDACPTFAKLWKAQRVDPPAPRTVRMHHPEFGLIEVHSLRFPLPTIEDAIMLLVAPASAETAASFSRVAQRLEVPFSTFAPSTEVQPELASTESRRVDVAVVDSCR